MGRVRELSENLQIGDERIHLNHTVTDVDWSTDRPVVRSANRMMTRVLALLPITLTLPLALPGLLLPLSLLTRLTTG